MASGDATTNGPLAETPDLAKPSEKPIQDEPMEMDALEPMDARKSEPTEMDARQSMESKKSEHMEKRLSMESKKSEQMGKRASMESKKSETMSKKASQSSASSAAAAEPEPPQPIHKKNTGNCTAFYIPALNGGPSAGRKTLRSRPVLRSCDPQVRKRFSLTVYAMLSGQIAVVALLTAVVAADILSTELGGWLPNDIAPTTPATPAWMPSYPFNVLMAISPAWLCVALSFVALSVLRYYRKARLFVLVFCTLITGISLGLLTYVQRSFSILCICIVLMSLVIHTLGICVNLVSVLASSFGQEKPKASKMEMMGRDSYLTGTEKFMCLLYDEEAAYTRASLVLAGLSWTAATVTSALVVASHDMEWLPWSFAALTSVPFVLYFTYGVEKQVRRCKPEELVIAIINLSIDLLFFVAECLTVDMNFLPKLPELGSALPDPVAKGSSFQYTMKQLSSRSSQSTKRVISGTTRSTTLGTTVSSSPSTTEAQRETVAV